MGVEGANIGNSTRQEGQTDSYGVNASSKNSFMP
jgi:hypothetical protein